MNFRPWRRTTGDLMDQMRHEMDQVFQRLFGEQGEAVRGKSAAWVPPVDVEETDMGVTVRIDLPGVDPNQTEITFAEGALVVQGQRKEERDEARKNYHLLERPMGRFYRNIALPPAIDPDKIEARSSNGVLIVSVPKIPEVQPKKIPISSSESPPPFSRSGPM
jgi:HSP20 family protein